MENEEEREATLPGEETEDKKSSISADLIRGHINTIILRSLYDGDRYGYDIINEIEFKSHGQYSIKQPTLYSALKRLEEQGYVRSYWGGTSGGGRRKYFSLTDEGKAIAKQNQEEWEYSRTIIDSLISDEDFDFSQPAPSKLDFRILRQTTSRTPIVEEEKVASESVEKEKTETKTDEIPLYITMEEEKRNYRDILGKLYQSGIHTQAERQEKQPTPPTEPRPTASVPQNNEKPVYSSPTPQAEPSVPVSVARSKIDFTDIQEKAYADGLRVWTAGGAIKKRHIPEDFYNKGKTLFQSALFVLIIALIETLTVLFLRSQIGTGYLYPTLMLIPPVVLFVVCGILWLKKYQPCVKRVKNNSSVFNGIVGYVIAFILLLVFDLLYGVQFSEFRFTVKYLIIPCVYLLNITAFFLFYYFRSRSKI